MRNISATIITFNEEESIERCLRSLSWVKEIIVVDSYSTDKTVTLCKKYGAKVFLHPWTTYAQQKNYSVSKTSNDWIFSIDADEEISEELKNEILQLDDRNPPYVGYSISRPTRYLGRWIGRNNPNYQIRLFHKRHGKWNNVLVHERLLVKGTVGRLQSPLLHYSYKGIYDQLEKIKTYSELSACELYSHNHRFSLYKIVLIFPKEFFSCYILKKGFLDGIQGFIQSIFAAYSRFIVHARLYELERNHSKKILRKKI